MAPVSSFGAGQPARDLALDLEHELVADPVRDGGRVGRLSLVYHDLGQAVPVPEVDEDQAAVIPPAMNPAGDQDLATGVFGAQLAARHVAVRGGEAERDLGRSRGRAGVTHPAHRIRTRAAPFGAGLVSSGPWVAQGCPLVRTCLPPRRMPSRN